MLKLIVNADDFGFSQAVNYGIVDAMDQGIVTSTTLMVTMPGVHHAVSLMKARPDMAVGLHLNIALLKPLTKANSLIKANGDFYKPKEQANHNLFNEEEIYLEFKAQYDLFVKLTDKKPTHLDSHLYTHQVYEKARNAALRLANEVELPIREVDCAFAGWFKLNDNKSIDELKNELITDKHNLLNNEIIELMVHPAYIDYLLMSLSSYNLRRIDELEILKSNEVKNFIKDNKIILTTFKEVSRKKVY